MRKQENMTCTQRQRQSMATTPEMTQILILTHKDFKVHIAVMVKNIKENMPIKI